MKIKTNRFCLIVLLATNVFCSDNKQSLNKTLSLHTSTLKDLAFQTIINSLKNFDDASCHAIFSCPGITPDKKKLIFDTLRKSSPEIEKKICTYTNKYISHNKNILIDNSFSFDVYSEALASDNSNTTFDYIDWYCKQAAQINLYTNYCQKKLIIEQEDCCQKTSFTSYSDNKIYLLTMPTFGPDNYSSAHQFYSYKTIVTLNLTNSESQELSKQSYEVKNECYLEKNDAYLNEPIYQVAPEQHVTEAKNLWLKNHELTNRLDTFPDGSLILTHQWGGIELHNNNNNNNQIKRFIINNSICSVNCSSNNNSILALGSYDGTITIIDISQEEANPTDINRSFKTYYDNNIPDPYYPHILFSYKHTSDNPITSINFCSDKNKVIFCSGENLYSLQTNGENPQLLFTDVAKIKYFIKTHDEKIICVSEENTITVINTEKLKCSKHVTITHPCSINTLCLYPTNKDTYFITGDSNGDVIIWNMNHDKLIPQTILPHAAPIHLVNVTKNNTYIIVKQTKSKKYQSGNNTYNKDNVIFYPTYDYFINDIQEYTAVVNDLTYQYEQNINNIIPLYNLLKNNQLFFFKAKSRNGKILKDNICTSIDQILTDQKIISSINSIDSLKKFRSSILLILNNGFNSNSNSKTFIKINNHIYSLLEDLAADVLTEILNKNRNNTKKQIKEFAREIFLVNFTLYQSQFFTLYQSQFEKTPSKKIILVKRLQSNEYYTFNDLILSCGSTIIIAILVYFYVLHRK
ncbi:MAG TPA: hypothetical protein VLB80_04225 [Candidatus Babeliales bacterium]|nr:hypothetical protein [Candidatus Babeliales bacterium]